MRSPFLLLGVALLALLALASAYPCPPDTPTFSCISDPCTGVKTCPLGCKSDYCGGCNARCVCRNNRDCARVGGTTCLFDKSGDSFGVCDSQAPPAPAPPKSCKRPCGEGQECRDGVCQPSCALIRCAEGYTCSNGQCVPGPCGDSGVTCQSYETCENGACVDGSCAAVLCAEGTFCRGGQCYPSEPVQQCPKCPAGNYCGAALQCQPEGSCSTAEDCSRDPTLIRPACVGTFSCEKGKCGFTCTTGGAL